MFGCREEGVVQRRPGDWFGHDRIGVVAVRMREQFFAVRRRDHDDRRRRVAVQLRVGGGGDRQSVGAGHAPVEYQDVEGRAALGVLDDTPDGFIARGRVRRRPAQRIGDGEQGFARERVVVDHEDALRRRRGAHAGGRRRRLEAEFEREFAAASGGALDAEPSAHQLDQADADREAEAGAAETPRRRAVGLGEGGKYLDLLFRRDADAGIGDREAQAHAVFFACDEVQVDRHLAAGGGELDRVARQVGQHLAQAKHVAENEVDAGGDRGDDDFQPLVDAGEGRKIGDVVEQFGQAERCALDVEALRLDLREIEDIVEDVEQRTAGAVDLVDHFAHRRVEFLPVEQIGEAEDRVHRRPDFVAHVGQELTLGSVGRFGDAFLLAQRVVQLLQSTLRFLLRRHVGGDDVEAAQALAVLVGNALHPEAALFAVPRRLELEGLARAGCLRHEIRTQAPHVLGRDEVFHPFADDGHVLGAEIVDGGAVGEATAQFVVPVADLAREILGERGEEAFALFERERVGRLLGDVLMHADHARTATVLPLAALAHPAVQADDRRPAVGRPDAEGNVERPVVREGFLHGRRDRRALFGIDARQPVVVAPSRRGLGQPVDRPVVRVPTDQAVGLFVFGDAQAGGFGRQLQALGDALLVRRLFGDGRGARLAGVRFEAPPKVALVEIEQAGEQQRAGEDAERELARRGLPQIADEERMCLDLGHPLATVQVEGHAPNDAAAAGLFAAGRGVKQLLGVGIAEVVESDCELAVGEIEIGEDIVDDERGEGPAEQRLPALLGSRRRLVGAIDRQQEKEAALGQAARLHQRQRCRERCFAAAHGGQGGEVARVFRGDVEADGFPVAGFRLQVKDDRAVAGMRCDFRDVEVRAAFFAREVDEGFGLLARHALDQAEAARAGELAPDFARGAVFQETLARDVFGAGADDRAARPAQAELVGADALDHALHQLVRQRSEAFVDFGCVVGGLLPGGNCRDARSEQQKRQRPEKDASCGLHDRPRSGWLESILYVYGIDLFK